MRQVGYMLTNFRIRDFDTGEVLRPGILKFVLEEDDIARIREEAIKQVRLGDKARNVADTNFRNGGFFGMWRAELFYDLAEEHYMTASADDFCPVDIQQVAFRRRMEIEPNMNVAKNYSPFRILW